MNKPATIQVRLPRSIKAAVERLAKEDGVSMNQMIATAVAEKVAVLDAYRFFKERAQGADRQAFRQIMNRKGGEPPRAGDELPEGWERTVL